MQETTLPKTPAQELLDLLITTQKLEQHYIFQIEFEKNHTVLNLFNKDHRLFQSHQAHYTNETAVA